MHAALERRYVQYGCGLCAPEAWENYDASPTLRIQQTPLLGPLLRSKLKVVFPSNVRYGNIIRGLPVADNSCDGAYCSHTLEHLSLTDIRKALRNTYRMLKKEAFFRCVVPDLEYFARTYLVKLELQDKGAAPEFMENTLLGVQQRSTGWRSMAEHAWGNSHHLWMWDYLSLSEALIQAGFRNIRRASFGDCPDGLFQWVEDAGRFEHALAVECIK